MLLVIIKGEAPYDYHIVAVRRGEGEAESAAPRRALVRRIATGGFLNISLFSL